MSSGRDARGGSGRLCYCFSCCQRRRFLSGNGGSCGEVPLNAAGDAAAASAAAPIDIHAPAGASRIGGDAP